MKKNADSTWVAGQSSARMDCLHFRSRTSSSKDALMANALVRGGLSGCSTTASGSASKLDEQCSWTSRSPSADSEANLRYAEKPQLSGGSFPIRCHRCGASPVTVCGRQRPRFGLFLRVLLAHLPLFDCATVWFPTGLLCQPFGDRTGEIRKKIFWDFRIILVSKIPHERAEKVRENSINGGRACLLVRSNGAGIPELSEKVTSTHLTAILRLAVNKRASSPSSSFRVRLAISLISMRDRERECVAEMRGVGGTVTGAGVVSTLLTRGDLRGLSMLRPTRLHRGILNMCLHADSPIVTIHTDAIRAKARTGCQQGKNKYIYIYIYETALKSLALFTNYIQRLHAATEHASLPRTPA